MLTDVEPIHALSASISNPVYFPVLKAIKHGSVTTSRSTASSSQTRLGDVHSFCTKEIDSDKFHNTARTYLIIVLARPLLDLTWPSSSWPRVSIQAIS